MSTAKFMGSADGMVFREATLGEHQRLRDDPAESYKETGIAVCTPVSNPDEIVNGVFAIKTVAGMSRRGDLHEQLSTAVQQAGSAGSTTPHRYQVLLGKAQESDSTWKGAVIKKNLDDTELAVQRALEA